MFKFVTTNENETLAFAGQLGTLLHAGDVITLEGDLGAGKTTFTKGLAIGLGINRTVNSPTFTIIKEYQGRLPLYHMDVYRLEDLDEDLGFEEYFNSDGVCVVEWARFIKEFLPEDRLEITIRKVDDSTREFTFSPNGSHFERICKELKS